MGGQTVLTEQSLGGHSGPARELAGIVRGICPAAHVYGRYSGGVLDLWTVLPERDDSAETSLAEAEWGLMERHPEVTLDFMLLTDDSPSLAGAEAAGYLLVEPA